MNEGICDLRFGSIAAAHCARENIGLDLSLVAPNRQLRKIPNRKWKMQLTLKSGGALPKFHSAL